jgi:chorismate mutase/GNAT superfamily N-acetyltransferase
MATPDAGSGLLLRPADEGDADVLVAIQGQARRAAPMPPGVHDDAEVRSWLAQRLRSDEVWVAELDGVPVGYARMTESWLDDLYVLPAAAGGGVGSALLDLVKGVRPRGFCLWVFETNTPARRFYESRGLVALERTDGSANEERAPDVRMAWPGEDPLAFLRGLIDEVDGQLGDLLARRVALTGAVQAHKSGSGRDARREREIAEAMARRAPGLGPERLGRIMDAIISESLDAAASVGD